MALTIIIRKTSAIRELMNVNLSHKISYMCNANIHNFKSFKFAPVLKNKSSFHVPKRNFYGFFKQSTRDELRIKDNVPDSYKLIYRSKMNKYILCAQIVTTVSAFIVTCAAIIKHDFSDKEVEYSQWGNPARRTENDIYVYLVSFIFFVVILQLLVSRLPIRIYNFPQQRKYIFVFYGNYPFTQKKLICKVGEVAQLPETGISPWRDSSYIMKDEHKLILIEQYFRRPADLYIMMGVQRDPDFEEE